MEGRTGAGFPGGDVWKRVRVAVRVMGGSAILMALLGDRVGLGSGGFGGIQALAVALGCGLLALGWAGSRTPAWYRGIAVMLLNVVVLLTLLELGAALVLKVLERRAAALRGRAGDAGLLVL